MTFESLVERYGPPIIDIELDEYTEDDRLLGDIPKRVCVFHRDTSPSGIVVYGRVHDAKWLPNYGERQLIKRLLNKDTTITMLRGQLQNCVNHLTHAKNRQGKRDEYDGAIQAANDLLYKTMDF